jgi:hypothetical protein
MELERVKISSMKRRDREFCKLRLTRMRELRIYT